MTEHLHQLICEGPPLARGVRMERAWHCTCGQRYHGFDSAVRREHREHLARMGGRFA